LESRNSIYHSAVTFANAFMQAGTTSDEFLRQNLDWLSRATNWSKFSATAALGVIHKGQLAQSMNLLAPYLPQEGVSGNSSYSEGGSLYALGLINANHGADVLDFLKSALSNTSDDVIQHGASLGLGVAGMATAHEGIFEDLKNVLFGDNAVAGEAAGLAMGLIMLGTGNEEALDEMFIYAHETQHEKIIRGLAIGMSLIMYGKEEQADALIKKMLEDKDPVIRYGGIYTIAMAYSGTGNNKAIRRLLHVAVSDVNDDVRRAAVTSLGFVLLRNPKQVPRIVQLLAESYNPHVRYGATLALGISCAGTGYLVSFIYTIYMHSLCILI
jgi:26S proteasome regulatory subunit N2